MAIITISRGSYSKGKEVAEKVASALGYECISRDILLEASEHFNIPEIKLKSALHDAPSILQRFTSGKERYLAYITAAFLERVHKDNVVYHGLAGQFMLRGVSHVLKVRILAEMEDRVALEMEREYLNRREALARLRKDDQERRQWSLHLFGVDTWNPSLYDLVVHVHKLNVQNAVDMVCKAARLEQFKATPQSQRALDDLLLAAKVRSRLVADYPMVETHATDGVVTVDARFNVTKEPALADKIKEMAQQVSGVKEVHMHALPVSPYVVCDSSEH
jgi:cytidylate kinase